MDRWIDRERERERERERRERERERERERKLYIPHGNTLGIQFVEISRFSRNRLKE